MASASLFRNNLLQALAVVAITVGTHLIWALMPLPGLPPSPAAPVVSLTALTQSRPLFASPILFSLPSSLGFSSLALQQRNRVLPPLNSPLDLSLRTETDLALVFPTAPAPELNLPRAPAPGLAHTLPPYEFKDPPVTNRWQLRSLQTTPDLPPLHMFRPPQQPSPLKARRITGTLQFNEFGQIQSLLIDPAQPPPTPDILQSLRLVRIPQAAAPLRTPFELTFQPAVSSP